MCKMYENAKTCLSLPSWHWRFGLNHNTKRCSGNMVSKANQHPMATRQGIDPYMGTQSKRCSASYEETFQMHLTYSILPTKQSTPCSGDSMLDATQMLVVHAKLHKWQERGDVGANSEHRCQMRSEWLTTSARHTQSNVAFKKRNSKPQ